MRVFTTKFRIIHSYVSMDTNLYEHKRSIKAYMKPPERDDKSIWKILKPNMSWVELVGSMLERKILLHHNPPLLCYWPS